MKIAQKRPKYVGGLLHGEKRNIFSICVYFMRPNVATVCVGTNEILSYRNKKII